MTAKSERKKKKKKKNFNTSAMTVKANIFKFWFSLFPYKNIRTYQRPDTDVSIDVNTLKAQQYAYSRMYMALMIGINK